MTRTSHCTTPTLTLLCITLMTSLVREALQNVINNKGAHGKAKKHLKNTVNCRVFVGSAVVVGCLFCFVCFVLFVFFFVFFLLLLLLLLLLWLWPIRKVCSKRILGRRWTCLRLCWPLLDQLAILGAILAHLRAMLAPSWTRLGPSLGLCWLEPQDRKMGKPQKMYCKLRGFG